MKDSNNGIRGVWVLFCLLLRSYGAGAIFCYKCDSLQWGECVGDVESTIGTPVVECQRSVQCVMSVVDNVTYRGCGDETPITGSTYKKICTQNLCNKGVFPPGRLKCHQCSDQECAKERHIRPQPCRSFMENDQCYIEVQNATYKVYRGCISDQNHTITNDAIYCSINGCNNQEAVTTIKCAECDSRESLGCKMDLSQQIAGRICNITSYKTCELVYSVTNPQFCFTQTQEDYVRRGCSSLLESRQMDSRGLLNHLELCNGADYCNRKCVKQQRCYTCNSDKNQQCRSNAEILSSTYCSSAEDSTCFACEYKNFTTVRGCGPGPTLGHANTDKTLERCYKCSDEKEGCNSANFRRCYRCSSDTDENCANWQFPLTLDIDECSKPNSACISKLFGNGTVVRGCESDHLNCSEASSPDCSRCSENFCNKNTYPANRLHCYQCSNSDECNILDVKVSPCLQADTVPANSQQGCLEYIHPDNGNMVRGCLTNASIYYQCLLHEDRNKCKVCYTDACNESPFMSKPKLSCFTCSATDLNCQGNQLNGGLLAACKNQIGFGERESCFITKHFDGRISRGCTFDRSLESSNWDPLWDTSHYCFTDACNSPPTLIHFKTTGFKN